MLGLEDGVVDSRGLSTYDSNNSDFLCFGGQITHVAPTVYRLESMPLFGLSENASEVPSSDARRLHLLPSAANCYQSSMEDSEHQCNPGSWISHTQSTPSITDSGSSTWLLDGSVDNLSITQTMQHSEIQARRVTPDSNLSPDHPRIAIPLEQSPLTPGHWRCTYPLCKSSARFSRLCDLRKHCRRHIRAFSCRYPGCAASIEKVFSTQKDRNRHEAGHRPTISCVQKDCGRVFSRVDNMVRYWFLLKTWPGVLTCQCRETMSEESMRGACEFSQAGATRKATGEITGSLCIADDQQDGRDIESIISTRLAISQAVTTRYSIDTKAVQNSAAS